MSEYPVASVDTGRVDGNGDVIHDLWIAVGSDPLSYVLALRQQGIIGPPHYAPIAIKVPSIIPDPLPVVYL